MSLRSRAREIVLQILYQDDMNKDRSTDEDLPFIKNRLHNNGNIIEFARELLDGVREKLTEIDDQLSAVAENWRISRMAATDRNVLRLGAFEILFYETPAKVGINEAIELAKRYGSELSPTFINGILDRLIKSSLPENESAEVPVALTNHETEKADGNLAESIGETVSPAEAESPAVAEATGETDMSKLENEPTSTSETQSETDTING